MPKLKIILYPAESLEQPSEKVTDVQTVKKLIPDMVETMLGARGIGLAAPQIGQNIRLAIINKDAMPRVHPGADPSLKDHLVIINPKIFSASVETDTEEEGCLSIPNALGLVPRHRKIKVRYTDASGQEVKIKAVGLFARVLQHEIDHLDGVLFIERATKMIKGF